MGSEYTGTVFAAGQGTQAGGAGTIYLRAPGQGLNSGTLGTNDTVYIGEYELEYQE